MEKEGLSLEPVAIHLQAGCGEDNGHESPISCVSLISASFVCLLIFFGQLKKGEFGDTFFMVEEGELIALKILTEGKPEFVMRS